MAAEGCFCRCSGFPRTGDGFCHTRQHQASPEADIQRIWHSRIERSPDSSSSGHRPYFQGNQCEGVWLRWDNHQDYSGWEEHCADWLKSSPNSPNQRLWSGLGGWLWHGIGKHKEQTRSQQCDVLAWSAVSAWRQLNMAALQLFFE